MQGSCSALLVQGDPYTLSLPMQGMAPPDSLLAVTRSTLNRQIKIKVTVTGQCLNMVVPQGYPLLCLL